VLNREIKANVFIKKKKPVCLHYTTFVNLFSEQLVRTLSAIPQLRNLGNSNYVTVNERNPIYTGIYLVRF